MAETAVWMALLAEAMSFWIPLRISFSELVTPMEIFHLFVSQMA